MTENRETALSGIVVYENGQRLRVRESDLGDGHWLLEARTGGGRVIEIRFRRPLTTQDCPRCGKEIRATRVTDEES